MDSLTIRMLVVIIPILLLVASFTLSQLFRSHRIARARKRLTAGALKGLSHGTQIRG